MNQLLFILSFVVSLILANPIVDSTQLQEKGEIVGDCTVKHWIDGDSIEINVENPKTFCQTVDKDCAACECCCNNKLNLLIGFAGIVISIVGLFFIWKSYKQADNSNQQAKASNELSHESYESFKRASEKQHTLQQETLEAIVKQTDKIYSTKQKTEIVNHFASCYSLMEMMYDFLLKHFGDVVRDTKEYSTFVFDTLQPIVKNASAIQMLIGKDKREDKEFLNALDTCTGMMNLQINNQKDMDDLLERLAICKKAFEKQKIAIDKEKELEENE